MFSRMMLLLTLLGLLVTLPSVISWGGQGHNATARLAQSLFTDDASAITRKLLPEYDGRIDAISSWADAVRYGPYRWSSGMHFADTPDFVCQYNYDRDCQYGGVKDLCVDGAVHNYTHRLLDASLNDHTQYREALEFLVHFVGDLHQPLHAGFVGDLGGTQINISWAYGYINTLHSLWDSGMISRRVALNFSNSYPAWDAHLQQLLQTTYKGSVSAWTSCDSSVSGLNTAEYVPCSGQWVQESAVLNCETVYVNETGGNMTKGPRYALGDAYYQRNIDLVEKRFIQAGVRMAYVINTIAAAVMSNSSSSSSSTGLSWSSSSSSSSVPLPLPPSSSFSSSMVPPPIFSTSAYPPSSSAGPVPPPSSTSTWTPSSTSSSHPPTPSVSSSTGGDHDNDSGYGWMSVAIMAVILVLVVLAVGLGFLFWRKRKYGLNSLFESTSRARPDGRRLLLDEEESTNYTRV